MSPSYFRLKILSICTHLFTLVSKGLCICALLPIVSKLGLNLRSKISHRLLRWVPSIESRISSLTIGQYWHNQLSSTRLDSSFSSEFYWFPMSFCCIVKLNSLLTHGIWDIRLVKYDLKYNTAFEETNLQYRCITIGCIRNEW